MINAKRIDVGREPVDIAEGAGLSGVTVIALENLGETSLWIGEPGNGWEIKPGKGLPNPFDMGSTDGLAFARHEDDVDEDETQPIQVLLSYTPGA